MISFHKITTGLMYLSVAGLVACNQGDKGQSNLAEGPMLDEYQSPQEVKFLYDDYGNVPHQFPVEILNEMRTQLESQGQTDLIKELESRYDMKTGAVLDPEAATRAEAYLKKTLKPVELETSADENGINPLKELPEDISIPEEIAAEIENYKAQGGK